MILDIISDYSCPFCYLAEVRVKKVLKDLYVKIELKHISYQLDEYAPSVQTLNAYEVFAKKYEVNVEVAKQQMTPLEHRAKEMGLVIDYAKVQSTNTLLAHRLAKAIEKRTKSSDIHLKLYQAYFEKGYNLSDKLDLLKVAIDCGFNETEFNEMINDGQTLVECLTDLKMIQQKQIQGIPQIFHKGHVLVKGLVEEKVLKEKITSAYLKMMENQ